MATDRTMTLYHITPESNWFSITQAGLLINASAGRRKAVWLLSKTRLEWGARHVAQRHQVSVDSLVVFAVRVRRHTLRAGNSRGLWYSIVDVSPVRLADTGVLADFLAESEN